MPSTTPCPTAGPAPRHRSRQRLRAAGGLATACLLALSTLATVGATTPTGAAPDRDGDRQQLPDRVKVTSVPVNSVIDGVRIDGSTERVAPQDLRAQRETFYPRATAAPRTAYQMPFRCGEAWVGSTRSSHSPSTLSVDWNRTDDFDKPVVASAAGTITTASRSGSGYGNYVVVDHGSGESTLYAHLNSIAVSTGDKVARGRQIGRLGTTGNSTGPHLHYEQRANGSVVHPYFDGKRFEFNTTLTSRNCAAAPTPKPTSADVPLAADVVDDAADEPVRWRPQVGAYFEARRGDGSKRVITMGTKGDKPVLGSWNGPGKANPGVFTPSTRTFRLRSPQGRQTFRFGYRGTTPVAGDWDGDGSDEVGVWRPAVTRFDLRGPNGGVIRKITFGESDQLPIVGDWNGDGKADVGTYDKQTRTFTIRFPKGRTRSFVFGPVGGRPIAGDWNGDGRAEVGAFNPRTGKFSLRRD